MLETVFWVDEKGIARLSSHSELGVVSSLKELYILSFEVLFLRPLYSQ
jgi:hypothetical protein